MSRFAVINGSTVVNAIIADSKEDAELLTGLLCVETEEGGPRWGWDGEKLTEPNENFDSNTDA
jgi:nucleoside-triphosphatase THEP1